MQKTTFFALIFLTLGSSVPAQCALPKDCRDQKLRAIKIEQAISDNKPILGFRSKNAMKKELRRLEANLWKQCRKHASELRDIHQQYM